MISRHHIEVIDQASSFHCNSDETLLQGMARDPSSRGFREAIPVGCRGGGCGVCRIQVHSGEYLAKKMSRKHVTEQEQKNGLVLACRIQPLSDLKLSLSAVKKTSMKGDQE